MMDFISLMLFSSSSIRRPPDRAEEVGWQKHSIEMTHTTATTVSIFAK